MNTLHHIKELLEALYGNKKLLSEMFGKRKCFNHP